MSALCLGAALPSLALAQDQAPGATLNYEGADINAVAREVSLRTGRFFVIDPRLSGRVNIFSPPDMRLSPDEVWEVFLATLQVNGFAAVPIGDREYKIVPTSQAIREGGAAGEGVGAVATTTRVVPLRYVDARTVAANLRGMVSEDGLITPIAESNSLVLVDTGLNVDRLLSVLARIDVDESVVRSIALEHVAAAEVANTLVEVIGEQAGGARPAPVSVVPVDASNTVILRGGAEEVARLVPIIEELDRKGAGRIAIDTVYLNHADAEELVPIIQQLIDSSTGGNGDGILGGIKPSVAFHKGTNALIINAPPDMQRHIRAIVSNLDIRRPQVLIEAVVVEISNTTARDLGVQYLTGGGSLPVSGANFANTQPNLVSAAGAAYFLGPGSEPRTRTITTTNPDGSTTVTEEQVFDNNDPSNAVAGRLVEAAVGELLSFNGFLFGAADQQDDGSVYGVLVSAIQADADSNVLSVPSVTLLDNETATLQVGQEIPIVTGEATGTDFQGGFRTIERKDVGNILEVTPQINEGNTVQLNIRLEVSSIGAFTALTEDIITNKSTVETVALAEDGQTLVIGGLIDNDRRETDTKVPFLGDIPLLGNLFKGQSRSEEDMTLMVFIRPTILRDGFTADNVTARKYEYVADRQRRRSKNGDRRMQNIMQNYLGPGEYHVPGAGGSLRPVAPPPAGMVEEKDNVVRGEAGAPPGE